MAFHHFGSSTHTSADAIVYNRTKDSTSTTGKWFNGLLSSTPWFSNTVPNFRSLNASELPPAIDSGTIFTSVCINTAIYLPWLCSQLLAAGVVIKRAVLTHIADAALLHHSGSKADLVVNCTGLMASKLGGVMDKGVIPARGQVVVVRNTPGAMYTISGTDDGDDEVSYIMQRAAGGGTVLGGTYQKGNWESQPNPDQAIRIMKRAIEMCPALVEEGQGIEGLSVVRHGVGLRPLREAGVRIEKEVVEGKKGKVVVVHNYGHGGWGYQGSYGCSGGAVELVDEALGGGVKAKL
jgi:D-amino-acid oxidase